MLDLARQVEGGTDQDFTGEFHPDPVAVKAWQTPLPQEDDGEFRYGNKSPTELRRMIEVEDDPVEKAQMQKIMNQFIARGWARNPDDPRSNQGGEPYRGEPKKAVVAKSMRDLGDAVDPVAAVIAGESGRDLSELSRSGEGLGMVERPGGVWEEM
jgi:hypothetical protein